MQVLGHLAGTALQKGGKAVQFPAGVSVALVALVLTLRFQDGSVIQGDPAATRILALCKLASIPPGQVGV